MVPPPGVRGTGVFCSSRKRLIAVSVTISRSDGIVTDGGRKRGRAVCYYPPGTGQAKAIHFSEDLGGESWRRLQRSVRRPVQLNGKTVTEQPNS